MKIMYTVIAILLIIGMGVIVAQDRLKKDQVTIENNLNQMNETNNSTDATTNTTSNNTNVTQNTTDEWEGKYQMVEFGNVVPDSDPMRYDAYAYTDITIIFKHDKGYEVTISQNAGTTIPYKTYGKGRITPDGKFEVVSSMDAVLLTLEHGDFGANTDTKITWGAVTPLLQTTTVEYVHVHKNSL